MALPNVAEAKFFVYEKAARHHHENDHDDFSPETGIALWFIVFPERLGIRLRLSDEVARGTLAADVAVVYDWDRPATPADDLDNFVISVAIPQVLNCASTLLIDVANSVGTKVPFHGCEAIEQLVKEFESRETKLSAVLERRYEERKAAEKAPNKHADNQPD